MAKIKFVQENVFYHFTILLFGDVHEKFFFETNMVCGASDQPTFEKNLDESRSAGENI